MLEIMIVLTIIGVLAALAVPVYQSQIQRSYQQEAMRSLGATRQAISTFFAQNGTYTGASIAAVGCNVAFCPNSTGTTGQTVNFTYSISANAATYTITATRNANNGGDSVSALTINQAGTITRSGVFGSGGGS